MNGETWTEYGWREQDGSVTKAVRGASMDLLKKHCGPGESIVGRTVTATPWLPVQDQP